MSPEVSLYPFSMSVQAQKLRELSIATAPELLRFKPRIEPVAAVRPED